MAGELLGRYFGHDVDVIAERYFSAWQHGFGELMLIALPMLLTSFFLRATTSKGKIILHAVPLAITGFILAAFVLPLLPPDMRSSVEMIWIGAKLLEFNKIIIGTLLVAQLIWLWGVAGREKSGHHKNRRRARPGGGLAVRLGTPAAAPPAPAGLNQRLRALRHDGQRVGVVPRLV